MTEPEPVQTIRILGDIPDALCKSFLQHLRAFDAAHPGCHFNIRVDAPNMTTEEMIEVLQMDPPFPYQIVIKRDE